MLLVELTICRHIFTFMNFRNRTIFNAQIDHKACDNVVSTAAGFVSDRLYQGKKADMISSTDSIAYINYRLECPAVCIDVLCFPIVSGSTSGIR